jgi:uncharacterized protein YceK
MFGNMKISHYLIVAVIATQTACTIVSGQPACTTVVDPRDSRQEYRVTYADINNDGYIDSAFFTPGGADGDFVMLDTDFDGRYDKATVYGYSIFEKIVDYAVYLDKGKTKLNRAFLSPYTYE